MHKSYNLYIGIDPDVDKSGFAVWDGNNYIELTCLSLPDLMTALKAYHDEYLVMIRLEAGWLAKGLNWHAGGLASANAVGRNHEIGRQIEKYCKANGIAYTLVKPLGYSSCTHERFCMITKWPKHIRTNGDVRVAALLVYGYRCKFLIK
jgi:hypothetical protein